MGSNSSVRPGRKERQSIGNGGAKRIKPASQTERPQDAAKTPRS